MADALLVVQSYRRSFRRDSDSFDQFINVTRAFRCEKTGLSETRTEEEQNRLRIFKQFLETSDFVSEAFNTLKANDFLQNIRDVHQFVTETLTNIWFKQYSVLNDSRDSGILDSSGFGHVMVGERRGNYVGGLHNWVRLKRKTKRNNHFRSFCQRLIRHPLVTRDNSCQNETSATSA